MIKAAFFDIDGTLLSFNTHQVSQGTIEAFEMLQRQGVKTFISSGRPKILIPPLPIHFDGYITVNGGYVLADDKVILRNPIPRQESNAYLRYVGENNITMMAFGEHRMYANRHDAIARGLCDNLNLAMPPEADIEQLRDQEFFQYIAFVPREKDPELKALLPHCRLPRWHHSFCDIVSVENSKASGIEAILKHLGIKQNETIAFGDGGNDIEMLEYCGIGVAMGNASEEVKRHANHVTTSVDEEGIYTALKNLNIIQL